MLSRPAGLLEQYHITRCSLGFDTCVINAAQYVSRNGQDLDQPTLFRGLRRVVESHPALGVRLVAKSSNKASFERLRTVVLSDVVEFSNSDSLQAVIEEQLERPLPTTSLKLPLWRVVVMKDNTVCFAWHHCIGDGISGFAFHRALLSALHETANQKTAVVDVVTPSEKPMAPVIEKILNLIPSWRKVALELYDLLAPVSWTRGASAWTGSPVSKDMSLRTRVRLVEITPSDAAVLLSVCRSHKATITSAFHTLAIATLSSLIPGDQHTTLSSYIPITLRNIVGVSEDVICDYASQMHTYPRLDPTFSWKEASQHASHMKAYRTRAVQDVGLLHFLFGNYASYFKDMVVKKRKGTLVISNVGRFDITVAEKEASTWTIGNMVFAQSDPITGAALKMNVVGDPSGRINIGVTWGAGVISDSFGDEFVSRFTSGVQRLLNTDTEILHFSRDCDSAQEKK